MQWVVVEQETLLKELMSSPAGGPMITGVQVPDERVSINPFSPAAPTATQDEVVGHATPDNVAVDALDGAVRASIVHFPFDSAATSGSVVPPLTTLPTAVQTVMERQVRLESVAEVDPAGGAMTASIQFPLANVETRAPDCAPPTPMHFVFEAHQTSLREASRGPGVDQGRPWLDQVGVDAPAGLAVAAVGRRTRAESARTVSGSTPPRNRSPIRLPRTGRILAPPKVNRQEPIPRRVPPRSSTVEERRRFTQRISVR
jgi:hypothetical protein